MRSLPENFVIPSGKKIGSFVRSIDREAERVGGIASVLGEYRVERKYSQNFNDNVLRPLSRLALHFERKDEDDVLIDARHQLANSAFSGMLFGNMLNELTYPDLSTKYFPYHKIGINLNFLSPSEILEYATLGGEDSTEGLRLGFSAMAATQIGNLATNTLETVNNWADKLIPTPEQRGGFVMGFGVSLYAAWDMYTDQLIAEGRPYKELAVSYYQNNIRSDEL